MGESPESSPSVSSSPLDVLDVPLTPIPPPLSLPVTENGDLRSTPPIHELYWLPRTPTPPVSPRLSPSLFPRDSPFPDDPHQLIPRRVLPENIEPPLINLIPPSPAEAHRAVDFVESPSIIPASPFPRNWVPHEDIAIRNYFFNLSAPKFAPMQFGDAGTLDYVRSEELKKPATDPPIYRLRIVCNYIPQWPVVLQPNLDRLPTTRQLPPITIGDILVKIYYCMHLPIQQEDWDWMPERSRSLVAKAYQRRCRLSGPTEEEEKLKGVQRIDFCGTHVWFDELVRLQSEGGSAVMMLNLSEGNS